MLLIESLVLLGWTAFALLIFQSPLARDVTYGFETVSRQIDSSYLASSEQEALHRQLDRLESAAYRNLLTANDCRNTLGQIQHAIVEHTLAEETAMAIKTHAMATDVDGNHASFRQSLEDGEPRELLQAMDTAADTAGIPPTVPPKDVVVKTREIIDRTLHRDSRQDVSR